MAERNYDSTTEYYPSKCRAPACRCESPCDDMGGTYICNDCGKDMDNCNCAICDGCGEFAASCECEPELCGGGCGEATDACECANIRAEHERDLRKDGSP